MTDEKIMNEIENELEAEATQALDALGAEKTAVMPAVEDGAGGADTEDDAGGDGAHGPAVGADDAGAPAHAEKKRPRKGVIAAVAAVAIVAAIACGVALASPATSGAASGVAAKSASSAAAATASKSSAGASASSAAATSSAAASSAASSSAAASKSESVNGGPAGAGNGGAATNDNGGATTSNDVNSDSNTNGGNGRGAAPAAQPQREKVWVPNIVTVVDQEAWDEPVYETEWHWGCSKCGDVGPIDGFDHMESHGDENVSGGEFPVQVQTGVIHHEAVTHTEDQGHWE